MKRYIGSFVIAALFIFTVSTTSAQPSAKFSYAAQKKLIPAELGRVYLGMPLKQFAAAIDLSKAQIDGRFDWLELDIPFAKGNITSVTVRVYGLSREQMDAAVRTTVTKKKDELGNESENEEKHLDLAKVGNAAIVYSMYLEYKPEFDLRSYVNKTYGPGQVRKKDDEYHFFDTQWTKKTPDGLTWLIRAFYEGDGKSLQLLGRIKGTEWDPEA